MAVVKELLRAEADGTLSFGDYSLESKTKLDGMSFHVSGDQDVQVTLGLESDTEYVIYKDDVSAGTMKTNLSGKISVSAELEPDRVVAFMIVKK